MARKSNKKKADARSKQPQNKRGSYDKQDARDKVDSKESNESKMTEEAADKKTNDPAWYAMDPQLLLDAASLPFAYPLGGNTRLSAVKTTRYTGGSTAKVIAPATDRIPGLVSLYCKPTFGFSSKQGDAPSAAATALYTQVRYVNSGRKNYDAPDLMIYCLAVADMYSLVYWLRRVYNYAFMYSQSNKYIGKQLLRTNGFKPESILNELANFRMWLNSFIHRLSSYAVPAGIPLFAQKAFMYSGLYIESDNNLKDQLYQYVPRSFYRFDLEEVQTSVFKGRLIRPNLVPNWKRRDADANLMTWQDVKDYAEASLAAFWGDEDFAIMSGDIVKAFNGNILGLEEQSEEGGIMPIKDDMVLAQMRNATIVNPNAIDFVAKDTVVQPNEDFYPVQKVTIDGRVLQPGHISQSDDGALLSCEVVDFGYMGVTNTTKKGTTGAIIGMNYDKYLNLRDDTSPAVVAEATRCMVGILDKEITNVVIGPSDSASPYDGNVDHLAPITCGTFIVTDIVVSANPEGQVDGSGTSYYDRTSKWLETSCLLLRQAAYSHADVDYDTPFAMLMYASMFHNFPNLYVAQVEDPSGNINHFEAITNIDQFTVVTAEMLARIHDVSLMSLLYVPGVAKLVNFSK